MLHKLLALSNNLIPTSTIRLTETGPQGDNQRYVPASVSYLDFFPVYQAS